MLEWLSNSHANALTLQKKVKDDLWEAEREAARLRVYKPVTPVLLNALDQQMKKINHTMLFMEMASYDFPPLLDLMNLLKCTMETIKTYVKKKRELLMQK